VGNASQRLTNDTVAPLHQRGSANQFEKRDGRWYLKYRYRRPVGDKEWGGKVIRDYLK